MLVTFDLYPLNSGLQARQAQPWIWSQVIGRDSIRHSLSICSHNNDPLTTAGQLLLPHSSSPSPNWICDMKTSRKEEWTVTKPTGDPPPTPLFVRWPQQFWGLKAKAQHNRSPDRNRKDLLFKVVPYPSEAIEQMLCLHSHAKCPDWVTSSTLRAVALLWHAVSWRDKGRREWGLGGG